MTTGATWVARAETSRLSLPNVPLEADVREGDLIVTSGLGDRFRGAAGRQDLDPGLGQVPGEFDDTGLVGNADQRTSNWVHRESIGSCLKPLGARG